MLKIHGVGGFDEVGKNMAAIEYQDDVMLCDAGVYIPALIGVSEREKIPTESGMRALGALPNDNYLEEKNLRNKVRAFLISHGHLDHVGAVPYIAHKYKAGIYGTPFTMEVLKTLLPESKQNITNAMNYIKPDGSAWIKGAKGKYEVEFINMTHSTLQCAMVAVHTPDGVVIYANDYKLDNTPVMGDKPNYKRLKQLSKEGVKALIVNCLYAHAELKTPSEKVARGLLEDVMFTTENHKSALIVTTFASHIARLKSIVEFGNKLNRKVVFIGRSLHKYSSAAAQIKQLPFANQVTMGTYAKQREKILKQVNSDRSKYLIVCTGHQGEAGAVLDRMSRNQLPFKLKEDDHIIFASKTIPTPENIAQRNELQTRLHAFKPRIFDNVHVSGHGAREDLRDLIKLTSPEHVIPAHGDHAKTIAGMKLSEEMGYKEGYNVHLLSNGKYIKI